MDTTSHKDQTWGVLGRPVPSSEKLDWNTYRVEKVRVGSKRLVVHFRTVPRHSCRRRSPGKTTGEEKNAVTSLAPRSDTHA
ncbi:hypothetical protein T4E_11935 [Trichinella pseudospiralis]|uniref:Uncharacterized protein n=1 Tax=Trichinella pseudospiralis TaxID=6337 RepID=A0A0V0XJ03_TRIPS|nr:hypothetical protein T4E_11935 [Trichinella pseudospiralis]